MEQVYLKGKPRTWHSVTFDLLNHFRKYDKIYETIVKKDRLTVNTIMKGLYQNISLNIKDFNNLARLTNEDQLKPFINIPLKSKRNIHKTLGSSYLSINKNVRKLVSRKKHKKGTLYVPNFEVAHGNFELDSKQQEINCKTMANSSSNNYDKNEDQVQGVESITDSQNNSSESNENNLQHHIFENPPNIEDKKKLPKFKDHVFLNTELLLEQDLSLPKNLKRGKHFLVSFRIHEPYLSYGKCRVAHFMQEICVLDCQTLECLRDKIICQWDFQCDKGEQSDHPDTPVTQITKDTYSSAMFYIGNTFYVDYRNKENQDYSVVIKKWAKERGISLGRTVDMRKMAVGNLKIRFGYPYVFIHQGCCEHLVIINDARLVTGKDPLSYHNYPMITRIPRHTIHNCMICSLTSSRWIVTDSDRMLYDFTYLCDPCFKRFHYKEGEKIGHFKAYRYNPIAILL